MDYESNNDEQFQMNRALQCPRSPNSMDYENNSDEEHDESFQMHSLLMIIYSLKNENFPPKILFHVFSSIILFYNLLKNFN